MKRKRRMYNIKYGKVLTSSKMKISRADQRMLEERGSGQATANPRSRCATLIRYSKAATIQTPGSGHEDPGLTESNPASTYTKASWRAQAVTCVHDQVMWFRHASTGNDQ